MKTDYDLIKDYLQQKGYSGLELEKAAYKTAVQVAAIQSRVTPMQPVAISPGMDARRIAENPSDEFTK